MNDFSQHTPQTTRNMIKFFVEIECPKKIIFSIIIQHKKKEETQQKKKAKNAWREVI